MAKQPLLVLSIILAAACGAYMYAAKEPGRKNAGDSERLKHKVRELPDSLFEPVEMEDLLDDKVYIKLASEGWYPQEIVSIMNTAIADKKAAKKKLGYGDYAKQWLPAYGRTGVNDSMFVFIDTTYTAEMRRSVREKVPDDLLNRYYPPETYVEPKYRAPRTPGNFKPGYFREPLFHPSCGRVNWMTVHPEDPDKLYVVADGTGIFKTNDCGKTWDCITDRIPDRAYRANSPGYSIPVDPDNWDHLFAFMNNNTVYETEDGGLTWTRVQGATHKGFKRGDCFYDKNGKLWFVGNTTTSWGGKLWVSDDKGVTWAQLPLNTADYDIRDTHPGNGSKGLWFQYLVKDLDPEHIEPGKRYTDRLYLPTSRSIVYMDLSKIKHTGNTWDFSEALGKLPVTVYGYKAGVGEIRKATGFAADKGADPDDPYLFPCPATQPGDLQINPNDPKQMWFATAGVIDGTPYTACYRSDDGGHVWETLQDVAYGFGTGNLFGNEAAGPWLGGFGVNFNDTTRLFACSLSGSVSMDGGRKWSCQHWSGRLRHLDKNGNFTYAPAANHSSDSHFIRSHKSGRVFRGADVGLLMLQTDVIPGSVYEEPKPGMNQWHHIAGDMGQNLFYHVAVNEFGDQVIFGNTQDNDGQTYRYGRWGNALGYEGSESFVNPYSGTTYVSGGGRLCGFDPEYMQLDSWWNAKTKADVVSGSWYITRTGMAGRTLMRCDDLGQTTVNLEPNVGEGIAWQNRFGLCRDKGISTIYVITNTNKLKKSTDNGNTFEYIRNVNAGSVLATDPNNSDVLYLGFKGHVEKYDVATGTYTRLGGSTLPNVDCSRLFFHEGSGDLYFVHTGSSGIYLLECTDKKAGTYSDTWKFWTKGYNSGKFGSAEINYTTQEMVISDYGRSAWCADLEHPADRFFDNGFALRQCSFKDGRRTIGIDTEWTIPLYYYFKWTVNDIEVTDCPYQYLSKKLNAGDRVQLELTLRESPDVHTTSAVFIVPEEGTPSNESGTDPGAAGVRALADANGADGRNSVNINIPREPGRAIYSTGEGRLDLGYFDYFYDDFTIDFWVRPLSTGTLLANKHRDGHSKGWELSIDNGSLKFDYLPTYSLSLPAWEPGWNQNPSLSCPITLGEWSHVAIVHDYDGKISLYVNGKELASADRFHPNMLNQENELWQKYRKNTLNSSMILSLFADGIERRPVNGSVDELKIWKKALSTDEVRREMHSTNCERGEDLVAYYNFNRGSLDGDVEAFTNRPIRNRVKAQVSYPVMNAPVCAKYFDVPGAINAAGHYCFRSQPDEQGTRLDMLDISYPAPEGPESGADAPARAVDASKNLSGNIAVYAFDADKWQNEEDNLDTNYFDCHSVGYMIRSFGGQVGDETLQYDFYPVEGHFREDADYRVYVTDIRGETQVWERKGIAKYEPVTGAVRLTGVTNADLFDKKIVIVTTNPAVELEITGVGPDGVLNIYDENVSKFPITATTISGYPIPGEVYEIESDGIVQASGLYFSLDKSDTGNPNAKPTYTAHGELRLDLSKLGDFNSVVRTTLRSKDRTVKNDPGAIGSDGNDDEPKVRPSMIPKILDIRNRIAPRLLGDGIRLSGAQAQIGDESSFLGIKDQKNMTMMAWVRIDEQSVLNSGDVNLMIIRGANDHTNGIKLAGGSPRIAYNNAWGPGAINGCKFTSDMLGKWVHLAMVLTDNQLRFYINGKESAVNWNHGLITNNVGPLFLGKNSSISTSFNNNDNFYGAFDQVGVWNRPLSKEEVIKYMFAVPPLDDKGLLSYATMDYKDDQGVARDIVGGMAIKPINTTGLNGTSEFAESTLLPSDPRMCVASTDALSPIRITVGDQNVSTYVHAFRGAPNCYLDHDFQNYTALTPDFYALVFDTNQISSPAEGATATMTYSHRSIMAGDKVAVALRRIGTTEHLGGFIHASAVENGKAIFEVPQTYLLSASEVMFFHYPDETGENPERPAQIQLVFGQSVTSELQAAATEDGIPTLVLPDGVTELTVVADVLTQPRNYSKTPKLVVDETTYASISREKSKNEGGSQTGPTGPAEGSDDNVANSGDNVRERSREAAPAADDEFDLSRPENRFKIKIDLAKVDKFGMNPITVKTSGATSNELKLQFCLEPLVNLSLANGTLREVMDEDIKEGFGEGNSGTPGSNTQNAIRTSDPIATLEINAEFLQGKMPDGEQVRLEVISDLDKSFNIGNGSLLNSTDVSIKSLEHHASNEANPAVHQGWNLIGNPYLSNINLTGNGNVAYDEDKVSKFIYQCNPVTGNFEVHDMTSTEENHQIHPFQAYFVQTMAEDAAFTVTAEAKDNSSLSRSRSYTVVETRKLEFELLRDDVVYDRVAIIYDDDADNNFLVNEDAAKLWNVTGSSPELFTVTADSHAAAINVTPGKTVGMGVAGPASGTMKLRLASCSGIPLNLIKIKDTATNRIWEPSKSGNVFVYSESAAAQSTPAKGRRLAAPSVSSPRFSVMRDDIPTGTGRLDDAGYAVATDGNECIVSGLRGDAEVSIFSPNGVKVYGARTSDSSVTIPLEDGFYIVVINENGRRFTSKIAVGS